jgi:hypothetical protein
MSAFEESIVRTYFEQHGFLVRRLEDGGGRKQAVPTTVFHVINPTVATDAAFSGKFLFSTDLDRIHQALVAVRDWHKAGKLTPRILKRPGDLYNYLDRQLFKKKEDGFKGVVSEELGSLRRLYVFPAHVTQAPHKAKLVDQLDELGIEGVFSFCSIFRDLSKLAMDKKHKSKDEVLELVRILAEYDLVKGEEQFLGF